VGERREEKVMESPPLNELELTEFKHDLEALRLFASVLVDSAQSGRLQHRQDAEYLALNCEGILDVIEEEIEKERR
jgi:hypothetical protein